MDLLVTPEVVMNAADNLAAVSSAVGVAHQRSAPMTGELMPAASDEVSMAITRVFSDYSGTYHHAAAKADELFAGFVHHLRIGAGAYAGADAENTRGLAAPSPSAALSASAAPLPTMSPAASAWSMLTSTIDQIGHMLVTGPLAPLLAIPWIMVAPLIFVITAPLVLLALFGSVVGSIL